MEVGGSAEIFQKLANFIVTDRALHEVLATISACLVLLLSIAVFLERKPVPTNSAWLPPQADSPAKRACEIWFLSYGCIWIMAFGVVIATGFYETMDKIHYMYLCVGLASPLLLQPLVAPSVTRDEGKPFWDRYCVKANLWIAIFSFIGNYWYTHYFYNVLKASYTFKSWDLNGVPIPLFFATHFYFTFYHTLSNMALRKTTTTYKAGTGRLLFKASLVLTMSYVTAFMEALTISGFPCYSFEDRYMAWVLGSWFYGIYFLVSFPMFLRVDEPAEEGDSAAGGGGGGKPPPFSAFQAAVESLATGMVVLCLLDFVRVSLGSELVVRTGRPCKLEGSLTCHPFTGQLC